MTTTTFSILALIGFSASFVAGMLGMGGGIMMLTAMSMVLDPKTVIPLHGFIQAMSNASRVVFFLRYAHWPLVSRFAALAIIGVYLGGKLWMFLPSAWLQTIIGVFIIFSVSSKKLIAKLKISLDAFIFLGLIASFLGTVLGALGPIIAPFYLHFGLVKEELIATKAICQLIVHLLKIIFFFSVFDFDYTHYASFLLVMAMMAITGTALAKRLIKKVPEKIYTQLFKLALMAMGGLMVMRGLAKMY